MKKPSTNQPVTAARVKASKVQDDVRQAERELHNTNKVLAGDTTVSSVFTPSLDAALEQNIGVEHQLHDAVEELRIVTELLKTAEDD